MPKKVHISENQAHLPFSTRSRGAFVLERQFILALGLFVGVLIVAYAYFIVASVSHTAAREGLARESAVLSGDVAVLEREYLARGSSITEAYARSLGFVTPSAQVFLTRAGSLTLRDAR